MAMEVDLALNARRFQAGTKDAEKALGDLSDVIDDFTRDATDAGEDGADSFDELSDAAKTAEREFGDAADAADDLRRELDQAEDAARDLGRKAEAAGDDARRGMDRAKGGVEEFRDEANSTARESAASFDGSAESIGDAFQEIAANSFAGFGPAGAVAGIAAAAGIGLAVAAFESVNEAEQQSRERAAEWAQAYIDAGSAILSSGALVAAQEAIYGDSDRYQEAQDNATEWGVTVSTAVAAMAGETWALEAANASLTQREEEAAAAAITLADGGEALADVLGGQTAETNNGRDALDRLNAEMAAGQQAAAEYSAGLILTAQNTAGATMQVDAFGDSIYSLPDGTQVYVDAETGQATADVDAIEGQIYSLDGNSATVFANANTAGAEAALNGLARHRFTTIQVSVTNRLGVPIAV